MYGRVQSINSNYEARKYLAYQLSEANIVSMAASLRSRKRYEDLRGGMGLARDKLYIFIINITRTNRLRAIPMLLYFQQVLFTLATAVLPAYHV
jgi:hypothetical protein